MSASDLRLTPRLARFSPVVVPSAPLASTNGSPQCRSPPQAASQKPPSDDPAIRDELWNVMSSGRGVGSSATGPTPVAGSEPAGVEGVHRNSRAPEPPDSVVASTPSYTDKYAAAPNAAVLGVSGGGRLTSDGEDPDVCYRTPTEWVRPAGSPVGCVLPPVVVSQAGPPPTTHPPTHPPTHNHVSWILERLNYLHHGLCGAATVTGVATCTRVFA